MIRTIKSQNDSRERIDQNLIIWRIRFELFQDLLIRRLRETNFKSKQESNEETDKWLGHLYINVKSSSFHPSALKIILLILAYYFIFFSILWYKILSNIVKGVSSLLMVSEMYCFVSFSRPMEEVKQVIRKRLLLKRTNHLKKNKAESKEYDISRLKIL